MSTIKTWQERIVGDNRTWAVEAGMKAEIAELRAALAASGGNAAPGLTDERAAFIDASQLNGAMAIINADGIFTDPWVEAHFSGWQMRAAIAASAPNAALVALKEACDLIRLEVADGVHTEEYRRGMAALSAAGQEVGK